MDFPAVRVVMSELNKEVVDLVWGRPSSGGVSASIFRRWTQGMMLCFTLILIGRSFISKCYASKGAQPAWAYKTLHTEQTNKCERMNIIYLLMFL